MNSIRGMHCPLEGIHVERCSFLGFVVGQEDGDRYVCRQCKGSMYVCAQEHVRVLCAFLRERSHDVRDGTRDAHRSQVWKRIVGMGLVGWL